MFQDPIVHWQGKLSVNKSGSVHNALSIEAGVFPDGALHQEEESQNEFMGKLSKEFQQGLWKEPWEEYSK